MKKITFSIENTEDFISELSKHIVENYSQDLKLESKEVDDDTYNVKRVAFKLQVHEQTVRRYIKADLLKATKQGQSYIITKQNYQDFINGKHKNI